MHRDAIFKRTYPGSDFDRGLWKQFWFRQQTYHTLCLPCISNKKDADRRKGNREEPNQDWGAILLDDASKDMLTAWYNGAQQNLFGKDGKPRAKIVIEVSDDDDDDTPDFPWNKERIRLNASSSKVAKKWLRTARARMQQRIDE